MVILRALGLSDMVDGTTVRPVAGAPNYAEKRTWKNKDGKAQGVIVTHLEEKVMIHIVTANSAAEMWEKLMAVYEKKSTTSLHLEQQKFFLLKCGEGEDLSTFLAKLEEIRVRIAQLGEKVSDKIVMTKILMALPDSYKHFVAAWESVPTKSQTIEELTAKLLVEEERQWGQDSSVTAKASAALAAKTVGKIVCFNYGKAGDTKTNCRSSRIVCHYCKKTGHRISECRYRLDKEQTKDSKRTQSEPKQERSNAFVVNCDDSENWLVDTGASEHMCHIKELFASYEKLITPRSVIIGDGSELEALGKGKIQLNEYDESEWIDTTLNDVLYVPRMTINLFSVRTVMDHGHKMTFDGDKCEIIKDGKIRAVVQRYKKLYMMNFKSSEQAAVSRTSDTLLDWHIV